MDDDTWKHYNECRSEKHFRKLTIARVSGTDGFRRLQFLILAHIFFFRPLARVGTVSCEALLRGAKTVVTFRKKKKNTF